MWCGKCQSEVAAEAAPDSQRWFCTNCGTELTVRLAGDPPRPDAPVPKTPPKTPPLDPQAILAKWNEAPFLDPFGPLFPPGTFGPITTNSQNQNPPPATPQPPQPPQPPAAAVPPVGPPAGKGPDRSFRLDQPSSDDRASARRPHIAPTSRGNYRPPAPPRMADREIPGGYRADPPSIGLGGPHFDPSRVPPPAPLPAASWLAGVGQVLAYVGATTLAIGAAMVLVGYLGGPSHYAPTGWFTTTVGQMLLFLGVITLVSAGMEQTTVEVSRRVDSLGDHLHRLERATVSSRSTTDLEAEILAEISEIRRQLDERE